MPPVDRKNPVRADSSESRYSLMEFMREFPDDDACLRWLWRDRYSADGEHAVCPRCEQERSFVRYETSQQRQSWTCRACGHHLHPTAGTIFAKSSTSLHLWFYAMFLVSQTRCGISAKQLERELGVTYKTAWRMLNLIRNQLMEQDAEPLSGNVEIDETAYGGKPRAYANRSTGKKRAATTWKKETVFGMVESGRIKATHLPDRGGVGIKREIHEHVLPASMIFTDDWPTYRGLDKHYAGHRRIKHNARIYVDGDSHTQTIDGFFGNLKNGIRGTYHAVSAKWLQGYLNEYAWRYNHRHATDSMFRLLLARATA